MWSRNRAANGPGTRIQRSGRPAPSALRHPASPAALRHPPAASCATRPPRRVLRHLAASHGTPSRRVVSCAVPPRRAPSRAVPSRRVASHLTSPSRSTRRPADPPLYRPVQRYVGR
ncbi:hypothetical protein [Saccharothrix sp. ALI-22-I]|uniref:hypothetical protein n=1 Tax=Saccharothrix sp. ALI-22-I TaxID=1933778 RepID=UPI00117B5E4E|nr:hypothetical protein [Saccharothrix sp. ALI-22-I]